MKNEGKMSGKELAGINDQCAIVSVIRGNRTREWRREDDSWRWWGCFAKRHRTGKDAVAAVGFLVAAAFRREEDEGWRGMECDRFGEPIGVQTGCPARHGPGLLKHIPFNFGPTQHKIHFVLCRTSPWAEATSHGTTQKCLTVPGRLEWPTSPKAQKAR